MTITLDANSYKKPESDVDIDGENEIPFLVLHHLPAPDSHNSHQAKHATPNSGQ
jgi:hypothetical protein